MATKKVTTSKAKTIKTLPKPKFGEVGYEFNIKAKIVEVYPEDDGYNYPFKVAFYVGNVDDWDSSKGNFTGNYNSKADLLDVVSKESPAVIKQLKQEELEKAKAEVARLTKELAEIK